MQLRGPGEVAGCSCPGVAGASWWTTPWHDESFCMQLDIVLGRSYAPHSTLCFYGSACTVRAHSSCPGHVDGSSGDVRSVFGSRV